MLHFRIISVQNKPPAWVQEGFQEYVKRLSSVCKLDLVEIPVSKPERESEKILSLIKSSDFVVALDVKGASWSTEELAKQFEKWQMHGGTFDFIIGGPEGLTGDCLKRANARWSLSALTFPHLIARIVLVEQLYRAWTILKGHPYHK